MLEAVRRHTADATEAVDIWFCTDTTISDNALLTHYEQVLEPQERAQHQRCHFAEHRHQYLVSRALVRHVLSLYAPEISPADWRFALNAHGKPNVAAPMPDLVRFNLSHTCGLIVMAVARRREVGVDVEPCGRAAPIEVAERFFATSERQYLLSLPEELRAARFYELWTLKEAHVKARGVGLTMPLSTFDVRLVENDGIELSLAAGATDEASRWALWLLDAGQHKVAVAADAGGASALEIAVRQIVPGHHHETAHWPTLRRTKPKRWPAEGHAESHGRPWS